jgi:hypothetical protein
VTVEDSLVEMRLTTKTSHHSTALETNLRERLGSANAIRGPHSADTAQDVGHRLVSCSLDQGDFSWPRASRSALN